MMKRLLVAIFFTVILVALCVTGHISIKTKMDSFKSTIDTIENSNDSFDNISNRANELERDFYSSETLLALFINHGKIDDLKLSITEIRAYADKKDSTLVYSSCAEAKILISDIIDDQRFSMHSLF